MSIIIWGPQGCGKTLNAEKLKNHYGMDTVNDETFDPYPKSRHDWLSFKEGKTLFLTCKSPGIEVSRDSRVIYFGRAMAEIIIKDAKRNVGDEIE